MSSGWFDCTEPSLSTSLEGKQGVQVVKVHRLSLNLLKPPQCRDKKVCRVLSHEFGFVRLCRTFSKYSFTEEARCAGYLSTRLE